MECVRELNLSVPTATQSLRRGCLYIFPGPSSLGLGLVLLFPHRTALHILKPWPTVLRSDFCPLPLPLVYLYTTPVVAYCVQAFLSTLRIRQIVIVVNIKMKLLSKGTMGTEVVHAGQWLLCAANQSGLHGKEMFLS